MQKPIKSFVLRAGRVSPRQQYALDHWLKQYEYQDNCCKLETFFGRKADTILEIGFGMGASLAAMAKSRPELNFLGIEVHRAGIGSLVAQLHDEEINNVRIVTSDAVEFVRNHLSDDVLKGVQIFFPDPWPKKRHHKRRLVQDQFVHMLASRLKSGGFIHCATDWQEYAEQMLEVLSNEPLLSNSQPDGGYAPKPDTRPLTKFEERGQRLGHGVWDLIFIRN